MAKYSEAVMTLLTLGEEPAFRTWRDYRDLGLTQDDMPILLDIMVDPELHNADPEGVEIWAPLHAWRALAQMRIPSMIDPYLELLDRELEYSWLGNDIVQIGVLLGPPIVPKLLAFLADSKRDIHSRISVVEPLEKIALKFVEVRRPISDAFLAQLRLYSEQHEGLNGFLITGLETLRVRKAIPLIAEVFAADKVEYLTAAWESVAETFGLPARSQPTDYL